MTNSLENAVSIEEHSLGELQHWLQYGKHTWSLGAGIIWLPYGLILMGLKLITVVFTPYMLWHLSKAKWYKSVVVFSAIVVLPFMIAQFIELENNILNFLFTALPFLTFYLFTYIISYMIGEHLNEIRTVRNWEREDRLRMEV